MKASSFLPPIHFPHTFHFRRDTLHDLGLHVSDALDGQDVAQVHQAVAVVAGAVRTYTQNGIFLLQVCHVHFFDAKLESKDASEAV